MRHRYLAFLAILCAAVILGDGIGQAVIARESPPALLVLLWIVQVFAVTVISLKAVAGSYAVVLVWSVMCMLPCEISTPYILAVFLAVFSISYVDRRIVRGIVVAFVVVASITASSLIHGDRRFVTGGGIISFTAVIVMCVALGAAWRLYTEKYALESMLIRRRRDILLAREIHDYITNDLADIILLTRQSSSASSTESEALTDINDVASRALDRVHKLIRRLEKPDQEHAFSPTTQGSSRRCMLDNVIIQQQGRLEDAGFNGTVLIDEHVFDDADETQSTLLVGLVRELFGNIRKHADPRSLYTFSLSASTTEFVVGLTDVPKTNEVGRTTSGLRSGLAYYKTIIEHAGGVFSINSDEYWSLEARLPKQ